MGAFVLLRRERKMTGKTSKGFKYTLDDDVKDDMELLEGLIALDNGEMAELPKVITALLGSEQKKAMYDFYRNKDTGRVSASAVLEALGEIFQEAQGDLKN